MNHRCSKVVLKKSIKHTRRLKLLSQNFTTCALMMCFNIWRVGKCCSNNTFKLKTWIIHSQLQSLKVNWSNNAIIRWINLQIWLNHFKPQKPSKTTFLQIFCIKSGRTIRTSLKSTLLTRIKHNCALESFKVVLILKILRQTSFLRKWIQTVAKRQMKTNS